MHFYVLPEGYYDDYYKNNTEFNYVNKYIKRNGAFFGGIMDVEPNSGRSIVSILQYPPFLSIAEYLIYRPMIFLKTF